MSPSGRSAAMERPSTGTNTPTAPAARIDTMAISFSFIASCLSVPSMALVQLQALAAACCTNSTSHGSICKVILQESAHLSSGERLCGLCLIMVHEWNNWL